MNCKDCVFRGTFQDMGASCDVCNLQHSLADAFAACEKSESCRHRFTIQEAKKIVIERYGEPQSETKRNARQSDERTLDDAFAQMAEAIQSAVNPLHECLQNLADSLKGEMR